MSSVRLPSINYTTNKMCAIEVLKFWTAFVCNSSFQIPNGLSPPDYEQHFKHVYNYKGTHGNDHSLSVLLSLLFHNYQLCHVFFLQWRHQRAAGCDAEVQTFEPVQGHKQAEYVIAIRQKGRPSYIRKMAHLSPSLGQTHSLLHQSMYTDDI